jgi:Protein of unknown function DUF262
MLLTKILREYDQSFDILEEDKRRKMHQKPIQRRLHLKEQPMKKNDNQPSRVAVAQEQSFPYFLSMRELNEHRERFLDIPQFQREFIWTRWQCQSLVDSMLNGEPVPQLEGYETVDEQGTVNWHLLDGVQRLNAVLRFMSGEYKTWTAKQKDNHLPNSLPPVEPGCLFEELSPRAQGIFYNYRFTIARTRNTSTQSLSARFRAINKGNAPLTPAEIYHALPSQTNDIAATIAKHRFWEEFYDYYGRANRGQIFQSSLFLIGLEMIYPRITFDLLAGNQMSILASGKRDNLITDTLVKSILGKLDKICLLYHGAHFSHRSAVVAMYQSIGYLEQAGHIISSSDKGKLTTWFMNILAQLQHEAVPNYTKAIQQMLRERQQKIFWDKYLRAVLALFDISIEIPQSAQLMLS